MFDNLKVLPADNNSFSVATVIKYVLIFDSSRYPTHTGGNPKTSFYPTIHHTYFRISYSSPFFLRILVGAYIIVRN